jgi:hypothetical protein
MLFAGLCLFLLSACGKSENGAAPNQTAIDDGGQSPQPPLPPTPPLPPVDPGIPFFHKASLWAKPAPTSLAWTKVVIEVVDKRLRDFELAADKETFCPGYASATLAQRHICWLRVVGGIVEFESSFRPDEPPFHEGNGVYSVGLMALSTGECPNAPDTKGLMDPLKNLVCGVNKMAALIARYKAIDNAEHKGASAYWSTLRPPYQKWDPVRQRWLNLGKQDKIIERSKLFNKF